MAYRRKHSMTRSSTLVDQRSPASVVDDDEQPSLAAQAIRASSAHHSASSLSSAYGESAFSSVSRDSNRQMHSPQDSDVYEYTSMRSLEEPKYGFWGVLARKARSIIEDDNVARQFEDRGWNQPQMFDASTGAQPHWSSESYGKIENPTFHKSSDAIASSLHYIGGTIKNAFEEGLKNVENRTADIIQETRKLQIRRKSSGPDEQNQPTTLSDPQNLSQTDREIQLKASRDVANAMAAKAKLLLRELKTVKADLAFAKERCTQLEEENKALRDSRHKGDSHEDDDLIRLQLETLLAEKGRLAHENSVYARENRFLREIVEYHQLTMQDVLQMDDDDNEEEVSDVVVFGPTNQQNSRPHSSEQSEASSHVGSIPCTLSAMPSSMIPEVSSPVPSPPTSL